jgi:hypothetical protein
MIKSQADNIFPVKQILNLSFCKTFCKILLSRQANNLAKIFFKAYRTITDITKQLY